jgi:predicted AlkP superfamily phosphohydrolase/phosphomutase
VFALIFGALLRLKLGPTLVLSLSLAVVGAWGGWTMRSYLPDILPVVTNPLKAAPFWETAAHAGVASRVYDGQQVWDREPVAGAKVLCGLGVPDASGGYVSFTIYTTDELYFETDITNSGASTGSGGHKLKVEEQGGVIDSAVYGPDNFWLTPRLQAEIDELDARMRDEPNMAFKKSMELSERAKQLKAQLATPTSVPLHIVKHEGSADVTIGTQTHNVIAGGWSDWFKITFELNPLLKVHAATRCRIVSLSEPFEMYLDTVQIDPAKPPFWQPISQPAEFSAELATSCGTFETVGWACLTHPFKDEVIDAITFLQDIELTTTWREKLAYDGLAKDDWKLLVAVFAEIDRVQHMMYQYYDAQHPLYDAQKAARKTTFYGKEITLAEAIPAMYRKVDEIVGVVVDRYVKPGDTLMLCADHGFQSFRRQVHVNNWLAQEGYLVMKPEAKGASLLTYYVDWSKTKAYAIGLGTVYINTKGAGASEPKHEKWTDVGCVEPADKEALCREIAAKFLAATDPDSGAKIGSSADLVSEIHTGPYAALEADLVLGFSANYRVSWATTSGGAALRGGKFAPYCVDNDKNWSGDHVSVDPRLVRGMFFSNRKCDIPAEGVNLMHIAPTALAQLGVALPKELDLTPLTLH